MSVPLRTPQVAPASHRYSCFLRPSNQIASVLTRLAWPDGLCWQTVLWLWALNPGLTGTVYRLRTAPSPGDWYPPEVCRVQPVQYVWWPH